MHSDILKLLASSAPTDDGTFLGGGGDNPMPSGISSSGGADAQLQTLYSKVPAALFKTTMSSGDTGSFFSSTKNLTTFTPSFNESKLILAVCPSVLTLPFGAL